MIYNIFGVFDKFLTPSNCPGVFHGTLMLMIVTLHSHNFRFRWYIGHQKDYYSFKNPN